jgi:hypothetical protein
MRRRALLASLGSTPLLSLAGCLSDGSDADRSTATDAESTPAATEEPTPEPTETAAPERRVGIGVVNETEETHALSIRLSEGDEVLLDRTVDVRVGVGTAVEGSRVGPGTYRVVAELDSGATLEYEWRVTDELGWLELVVTDEGVRPRQRASGGVGDDYEPYEVDGAPDIFAPPSVEIRNDSGTDAAVTVAIEYEGNRFFEHTFDATTDREITTPPVVASAATYDVVAETADGGRATYEWEIPREWNWPKLAVLVAEDGSLRVGCDRGGETSVRVENGDDAERELSLSLRRGGTVASETTVRVDPGETTVSLAVPIGDVYELRAETSEGVDAGEFVACYCWTTDATVTVTEGTPKVDPSTYVCE